MKITLTCDNCGSSFEREARELKRSKKVGRMNFCSRKCAGRHNLKNFGDKLNRIPPKQVKGCREPFGYILRNCRRREQEFSLTPDILRSIWNRQDGICPYSGVKLLLGNYSKRIEDQNVAASLDRIDSSKGYTEENVQFVSKSINYMKNTMSHEETIDLCKKIAEFWKERV